MGTTFRLAAVVAAALLATVIGASLVGGGLGRSQPTSTPSPTPTPRALTEAKTALDPGNYVTAGPFPMRITFTVPAGTPLATWKGNIGGPNAVWLEPDSGPGLVSFTTFDKVYADPCHFDQGLLDPLPGPSVDDLATALASLPGMDATAPTDVNISGYQGKLLTLTAPDTFTGCTLAPGTNFRVWVLPLGATNDMSRGERQRVWILDVEGKRLVIQDSQRTDQTAEAKAAVQVLLDSIRIAPTN